MIMYKNLQMLCMNAMLEYDEIELVCIITENVLH